MGDDVTTSEKHVLKAGPRVLPGRRDQILTTRVGLRLPDGLSFEAWEDAGPKLFRIVDSSAWCLGDWLVFGQNKYDDRYRRAIDKAGLDYQTLRNYAWVARKFELSRRRDALSFQHHAELASLEPREQDGWLDRAEEHGWSRNQLRRQLRDVRETEGAAGGVSTIPALRVDQASAALWTRAADSADTELRQWIVTTLNQAAADALDRP
ncbi:LmbU family transcriptional regulator [Lentzea sp. NPDC059081]|uniref:LmbU family transcriptional regulator n=1 Tax=Lentzea sp. NPDC059081 TaxID=3346719 RepID=UPI00369234F1